MSRKRVLVLAVAVATSVALVSGATASAAARGRHQARTVATNATSVANRSGARPPIGTVGGVGIFTERCGYSHTANVDPILMPGMRDMSMLHDFFGNTTTDENSTAASLVGGSSTCATSADTSAYWTPALYQDGHQLTPVRSDIYWRAPGDVAASVHTMPAGLSMIAGNEQASAPQGLRRIAWTCTARRAAPRTAPTAEPHACAAGSNLRVAITFPSCWDGHSLDGASQTNVVYPGRAHTCPADHPVRVPELVLHVVYPTSSATGLTLSIGMGMTGSVNSEHADFINAFSPAPLAHDVSECIVARVRCGPIAGAAATPLAHRPR